MPFLFVLYLMFLVCFTNNLLYCSWSKMSPHCTYVLFVVRGCGQGALEEKSDGHDHDDAKTTEGPNGSRGLRRAKLGGSGGLGGGSVSDKRRLRASMEQLWRVYEVVMKRELQLKGSVGIFNKV